MSGRICLGSYSQTDQKDANNHVNRDKWNEGSGN